MKRWILVAVGIIAIAIGAVWTMQGLGYLAGSVMTDERIWAVVGPLVALAGLGSVIFGLRAGRR